MPLGSVTLSSADFAVSKIERFAAMLRKLLLTLLSFLLATILICVAVFTAAPTVVGLPEPINAETPCPVAGCTQTDGACHAAGPVPTPDGREVLVCPIDSGCSSQMCHAWNRIVAKETHAHPSDASLNIWILAPVILTVALIVLLRKLK